jgi:hypothetical protein
MKYLMCYICPPIACCMAGRVDKAVYQLIVALFAAFVLNMFSFVLFPVFVIWAWKVCRESDKVPQESRAAADMKLLLEAQHRLLQATNPEAFKELLQREEAERVAKAKNGRRGIASIHYTKRLILHSKEKQNGLDGSPHHNAVSISI